MGTPEFAVPSLTALIKSDHSVIGVVTVPDKPSGRGQKLRASAVKKIALKYDLPVYQPADLKGEKFLQQMRALSPDLMVVVAFKILPEILYTIPQHGSINLHASLLPKYRGAAPIQRAIMAGESETGVTTFFLQPAVDTGDILVQESISIGSNESAGSVHDRLAALGARVVVQTVDGITRGTLQPSPQDDTAATPAPKIHRKDCKIDWARPVKQVHDHIRALSPYPGAYTNWQHTQLKIFRGVIVDYLEHDEKPGTVTEILPEGILVACASGHYTITRLQPAGKQRMDVADFVNGYDIIVGEQFC